MRKREILVSASLTIALSCATYARAQEPSQSQDSGDSAAAPAAANSNPAPTHKDKGKVSSKAGSATDTKPVSSQDAKPVSPQDASEPLAKSKASTAEDNPFPEDVSKQAAAEAKAAKGTPPDAPSANSAPAPDGSSPPATGSSSRDNTDKLGIDDPSRRQLKLESPDGSADVYDPKRASEDVRVGKFYLQTGYYRGAYSRFKDATTFDHENVEAVFWLAEAARKMNLDQEAAQNYQLYLAASPDGSDAKAARKALGELASGGRKP